MREAYLLDGADDIDPRWLEGKSRIGVTAGTSAPEVLVREVLDGLRALGASEPIEGAGRPEKRDLLAAEELRIEVKTSSSFRPISCQAAYSTAVCSTTVCAALSRQSLSFIFNHLEPVTGEQLPAPSLFRRRSAVDGMSSKSKAVA